MGVFFFSSRRRHTRWTGDWSSDVCSSDLAVQGLLESASRIMLRRHLETCVATAMREGRTAEIVEELMETLKFDHHVFRPAAAPGAGAIDAVPELPGVAS